MKLITKIVALAFLTGSTAAFANSELGVVEACCALAMCCGLPCC